MHLLEMSPEPEPGNDFCRPHGGLCPDAGHILPGHIYVLCGEYEKARIAVNTQLLPWIGKYLARDP